jgi:hypothetical protein
VLALLLLVQTVEGKGSPTADIPRIEAEVRIDGLLDEPAWSQATRLSGFWQYQPVDGRPAEERTEVLVWYAPDAIYFGIIAHDKVPAAIRATVADRDNLDHDDHIVLDLDTFRDRRRAFSFAVNPLGAQSDGVRSEGAGQVSSLIPGSTDLNPGFLRDSKGRITATGYQVEVRFPFKSLRYPGGDLQSWGFNVTRVVQRTGYTDTWTDVRRANASFLGQEGAVGGLHDLEGGVAVEAQPFVTATASGALFIGGVAQPETAYNGLRVDLLASYEPTPGTVAFLGYGSTMETEDEFDWSGLERVNDGFFVKLAYQIRR